MKLSLCIDESGNFFAKNRASVVVGCLTQHPAAFFKERFKTVLDDFNSQWNTRFGYPDDVHCMEIIEPTGANRKRYGRIPEVTREELLTNLLNAALSDDLQLIVSKNPANRPEWDEQHAYVETLLELVWAALDNIAAGKACCSPDDLEVLNIVIATRRYRKDNCRQEPLLRIYLKNQVAETASNQNRRDILDLLEKVVFRHSVAQENAGLIAADICTFHWGNSQWKSRLPIELRQAAWQTTSRQHVPGHLYEAMNSLYFADPNGHYTDWASIYEYSLTQTNKAQWQQVGDMMLESLKRADDTEMLEKQLPLFWHLAEKLVRNRNKASSNLPAAERIYAVLVEAADNFLEAHPDDRQAKVTAEVLLDSIDGLIRCANHAGATDRQESLKKQFDARLQRYSSLIGGHIQSLQRKVNLHNRACNQLMNDYRFAEAIDMLEPHLDGLNKLVPDGQIDENLGKVQGSIGQAFAFMARTDPSQADMAQSFLTDSLRHLENIPGYAAQTRNYLATLAWQKNELADACKWMARQPDLEAVKEPRDLWQHLSAIAERPFDLANALRILAADALRNGQPVDDDHLDQLTEYAESMPADHPAPQICKWLAVLNLAAGQNDKAQALAEAGIRKAHQSDFTVRTIAASLLPVLCKTAPDQDAQLKYLGKTLRSLARQSEPFARYLQQIGGIDEIVAGAASNTPAEFWQAITFPPFAYA